ncbi:hypothetical protein S7711_05612 [Stachybotrys chartarum IBT 7711]|uniref:Uncharacterized protein n=1 Tax=Stachybotrys chartarum (strain CBS 109288 / IBT 7711) TaxID=1280523 RepID=A0A084B4R1_STACB|nr:hypothetical protein S7711_05612 [Stachybotrys chartarum IBT 7711]
MAPRNGSRSLFRKNSREFDLLGAIFNVPTTELAWKQEEKKYRKKHGLDSPKEESQPKQEVAQQVPRKPSPVKPALKRGSPAKTAAATNTNVPAANERRARSEPAEKPAQIRIDTVIVNHNRRRKTKAPSRRSPAYKKLRAHSSKGHAQDEDSDVDTTASTNGDTSSVSPSTPSMDDASSSSGASISSEEIASPVRPRRAFRSPPPPARVSSSSSKQRLGGGPSSRQVTTPLPSNNRTKFHPSAQKEDSVSRSRPKSRSSPTKPPSKSRTPRAQSKSRQEAPQISSEVQPSSKKAPLASCLKKSSSAPLVNPCEDSQSSVPSETSSVTSEKTEETISDPVPSTRRQKAPKKQSSQQPNSRHSPPKQDAVPQVPPLQQAPFAMPPGGRQFPHAQQVLPGMPLGQQFPQQLNPGQFQHQPFSQQQHAHQQPQLYGQPQFPYHNIWPIAPQAPQYAMAMPPFQPAAAAPVPEQATGNIPGSNPPHLPHPVFWKTTDPVVEKDTTAAAQKTPATVAQKTPAQTKQMPGVLMNELQCIQRDIDRKKKKLAAEPGDPGIEVDLKNLQNQLNSTLNSITGSSPGVTRAEKTSKDASIPKATSEDKATAMDNKDTASAPSSKKNPKLRKAVIDYAASRDSASSAHQSRSEVQTLTSSQSHETVKPPIAISQRSKSPDPVLRHQLCSGCSAVRSNDYQARYPLLPGQKRVPNYCTKCRATRRKKHGMGYFHYCTGCGRFRSSQYQKDHPAAKGGPLVPNYCVRCTQERTGDEALEEATVVHWSKDPRDTPVRSKKETPSASAALSKIASERSNPSLSMKASTDLFRRWKQQNDLSSDEENSVKNDTSANPRISLSSPITFKAPKEQLVHITKQSPSSSSRSAGWSHRQPKPIPPVPIANNANSADEEVPYKAPYIEEMASPTLNENEATPRQSVTTSRTPTGKSDETTTASSNAASSTKSQAQSQSRRTSENLAGGNKSSSTTCAKTHSRPSPLVRDSQADLDWRLGNNDQDYSSSKQPRQRKRREPSEFNAPYDGSAEKSWKFPTFAPYSPFKDHDDQYRAEQDAIFIDDATPGFSRGAFGRDFAQPGHDWKPSPAAGDAANDATEHDRYYYYESPSSYDTDSPSGFPRFGRDFQKRFHADSQDVPSPVASASPSVNRVNGPAPHDDRGHTSHGRNPLGSFFSYRSIFSGYGAAAPSESIQSFVDEDNRHGESGNSNTPPSKNPYYTPQRSFFTPRAYPRRRAWNTKRSWEGGSGRRHGSRMQQQDSVVPEPIIEEPPSEVGSPVPEGAKLIGEYDLVSDTMHLYTPLTPPGEVEYRDVEDVTSVQTRSTIPSKQGDESGSELEVGEVETRGVQKAGPGTSPEDAEPKS